MTETESKPVERTLAPYGLAAFRIGFGTVMVLAVVRFFAYGWVDSLYVEPQRLLSYPGLDFVHPLPAPWLHVHFSLVGLAAALLAIGVWTRLAAAIFAVLFTWIELLDAANYLNHYYLVSLLAVLLVFVPTDRVWAVRPAGPPRDTPRWAYTLLRVQIGLVYFFAGLAKLDADWLVRAEPLRTWLGAFEHLPVVGPLLAAPLTAHAMSVGGALYDLSVPFLLSMRRTRPWALLAALGFHLCVWALFPIGVFSWVMLVSTTVFLPGDWPIRALRGLGLQPREVEAAPAGLPLRRHGLGVVAAWLLVQVFMPLRHLLYTGSVNWTEEGGRFSWRVMLIEKTGTVEYRVHADGLPRAIRVFPRHTVTAQQYKALSTQPDLIHLYARTLADDARRTGHTGVRVYADAFAALNGRPAQRLIDPDVDLAAAPLPGLAAAPYILPLKDDAQGGVGAGLTPPRR